MVKMKQEINMKDHEKYTKLWQRLCLKSPVHFTNPYSLYTVIFSAPVIMSLLQDYEEQKQQE